MKTSRRCFLAAGSFLVWWLGMNLTFAEFILPEGIAFISNGEDTADLLIDDFDLIDDPPTPESTHDPFGGNWSAVGSIKADVIFDLGKRMSLTKVYIWNFNADGSTDAGMKDIEIAVSPVMPDRATEANLFTTIAEATLEEGGEEAQVIEIAAVNTRLIRIRSLSNYGNGFTIGLAEVRFESGEVEGNVPSLLITKPDDGEVFPPGTPIEISSTGTKENDHIVKTEVFVGGIPLENRRNGDFILEGAEVGEHVIKVVATEASGHIAWNTITISVRETAGGKISQIDDTDDEGEDVGQILYTGGWNLAQGNENDPRFMNNDHWSNEADSFFEVKFLGSKIDVYATVASHHGSATASIDDGPEIEITYSAEQRGEQVFIWGSDILPFREHVLRITNVGDGVVTADRFDVHEAPLGGPGFRILEILHKRSDNPSVDITWSSIAGETFTIERGSNLVEFIELEDGVESGGTMTTYTDTAPPPGDIYYRVVRE